MTIDEIRVWLKEARQDAVEQAARVAGSPFSCGYLAALDVVYDAVGASETQLETSLTSADTHLQSGAITRAEVQEVLDLKNSDMFWSKMSLLSRAGLPRDVQDAGINWDNMVAALTRWRDSLPEPPYPAPVPIVGEMRETARKTVAWLRSLCGGGRSLLQAAPGADALPGFAAWGYDRSDGDEARWAAHLEACLALPVPAAPVNEAFPARLRDRREKLGLDEAWGASVLESLPDAPPEAGCGPGVGQGRLRLRTAEGTESGYAYHHYLRSVLSAALTAEEQRQAQAPKTVSNDAYGRAKTKLDAMTPDELVAFWERLKAIPADGGDAPGAVTDVPQPVVKRFDGIETRWVPSEPGVIYVGDVDDDDFEPTPVPIALLRAMLADIDKQP